MGKRGADLHASCACHLPQRLARGITCCSLYDPCWLLLTCAVQSGHSGIHTPLTVLESQAVALDDPTALLERVAQTMPLLGFLEGPQCSGFYHRSGVMQLGEATVSCSRHAPIEIGFGDCAFSTLILPLSGNAQVRTDGQRLSLQGGPMAAYLPGAAFTASTDTFEEVMICLDRRRLAETASALVGQLGNTSSFVPQFQNTLLVDGSGISPQADLLNHLHLALRLVEAPLLQSVGGIKAAQLEDLVYRLVAAILCPAAAQGTEQPLPHASGDQIFAELLEWIEAHLHTAITPTELSRRSCYSVRNLQYLFQDRFGCSPMQWVKQRRLHAVHRELLHNQSADTVATIARRYGFIHLSSFAASYKRTFGVPPSSVLRHSRSAAYPPVDAGMMIPKP